MLSVLIRYWKPLVGALAMLVIIGAVLMYGSHKYDQGVSDEKSRQAAEALKAATDRGAVEDAVRSMPPGASLSELRRDWSRD